MSQVAFWNFKGKWRFFELEIKSHEGTCTSHVLMTGIPRAWGVSGGGTRQVSTSHACVHVQLQKKSNKIWVIHWAPEALKL